MIPRVRPRLWLSAAAMAAVLAVPLAQAQQQPPYPPPGTRPQPAPKAAAPAPKESTPSGESALRQRVEQLEEQLVEMQVVIGTLESLARGSAAPSAGAPGGGRTGGNAATFNAAEAGRLDGLETQLQALAAQLEQLQDQMRALGGRSGALAPSSSVAASDPPQRPGAGRPQADAFPAQPERPGFGSVTVSPGGGGGARDEIDRLLTDAPPPGPGAPPGRQMAAAPPMGAPTGGPEPAPKQIYETAYGYLLQRDYGAAEAAFDDFVKRYPSDPLAGNAQYWLGESLYVRGQYRAAANAFLKGYQTFSKSAKAPESLLKLAMSLQRLGQKDAACSSFNELTTKFPNAPANVKNIANAERQRGNC